jgi:hypothetical protein
MSPMFQWIARGNHWMFGTYFLTLQSELSGKSFWMLCGARPDVCLPPSWLGEFHKVVTKNGIHRRIVPSIDTIIVNH